MALGVQSSTVSRWERGESWPSKGTLHFACRQLGASAAEIETLKQRGIGPGEVPQDYAALFEAIGGATGADDELKLLSLEGALWLPARTSDSAREMLGLVLAARAKWLTLWDRQEAVAVAESALSLVKPDRNNIPTWLWPIHILAKSATQSRRPRPKDAIDRIQTYEALLVNTPVEANWYRRLKAEYVAKTGALDQALSLSDEALALLADVSYSSWYTWFDRATMLVEAGHAGAALDLIFPAESQHPAIVGRQRLVRGQALMGVGRYSEAESVLQEALSISLDNALPQLASSATLALQRQEHRIQA